MSIQDLEAEVERLSPSELTIFSKWFAKFAASFVEEAEHAAWGVSRRKDSPLPTLSLNPNTRWLMLSGNEGGRRRSDAPAAG